MSYYELFQQGPEVVIPVLLISIILTLVMYGSFPMIFAVTRKYFITKKKYKRRCYWINIVVMCMFVAFNGSVTNGAPYWLWTWIFSNHGLKILESRGLLLDGVKTVNMSGWQCSCGRFNPIHEKYCVCEKTKMGNISSIPSESASEKGTAKTDRILFCRKCGEKLIENSRFCRKCGTRIVGDKNE